MGIKSIALGASALVLSTGVNAVVLNTLNGDDYEWLKLTETQGLSRDAVELRLADVNDALYGYEYASRQLVEDLLYSYATWDDLNGWHGAAQVVTGMSNYIDDFGATILVGGDGIGSQRSTVDVGVVVNYDGYRLSRGFFGATGECVDDSSTCFTNTYVSFDALGVDTTVYMIAAQGWSTVSIPYTVDADLALTSFGSFLVREAVVPVPAAVWLFCSGLLGLVGVTRRKVRS